MKIAFTLCSNNYLAQAKALGDSFLKFNPSDQFIIGLVDDFHPEIDYSDYSSFRIIQFRELGFCEFDDMIRLYNIMEFNTAVKPYYIDYIFREHNGGTQVYYIDPDIEVFSAFSELESIFNEGYDFIITPHILQPIIQSRDFERIFLNVGVYNLGFLGIKKSQNSRIFVDWWKSRLRSYCRIDYCSGLFTDQIWINFLPVLFEKVYTLKNPGYNMGHWNLNERSLSHDNDEYFVNQVYKLVFFHFSSFNPLTPTIITKHQCVDSFESRPDLVKIFNDYTHKLLANDYLKLSLLKPRVLFRDDAAKDIFLPEWKNITIKMIQKIIIFIRHW